MDLSFVMDVQVSEKPVFAEPTGFTDKEAAELFEKLKKENRGVYVNKFDKDRPYRVSLQYNQQWYQFGTYADIEAASAVSQIAAQSVYGKRAQRNNVDWALAQESDELKAWLADERNADTIARAEKAVA